MPPVNTNETLDLIKAAQGQPSDALAKDYTQATGLVFYDLRAPAVSLFPVLTPHRNAIPRKPGRGGTAIHWKGITGIDTTKMPGGVAEGKRGGIISTATKDYLAAYRGIGLEDFVTFEADYAGQNFQDVKATSALNLLRATMIMEEAMILGGNTSLALGTTPTPTVATATTGGSIGASTAVSVICVALTPDGYRRASLANGVVATVARTNADGTTDTVGAGAARKSSNGSVTTGAGSTNVVSASVTPVVGAVAYAWFAGTAGSEKIAAITTINSVVLTAIPGSGQLASALPAADNSTDALAFDGLLTFAFTAANGGLFVQQATGTAGAGTALTSDGAGGVTEINDDFQFYWDSYKLSPTKIWVSAQESQSISKLVVANGGAPILRVTQAAEATHGNLKAGAKVTSVLNKITGDDVPLEIDPNLMPGTMLYEADRIPYPLSGVQNVKEIDTRREYYQIEWPLRTRKYEYGVYADEVLRVNVPFTLGVRTNIAPSA